MVFLKHRVGKKQLRHDREETAPGDSRSCTTAFFLGWEPRGTGSPVLFPGWHSQIPCRLPTGPCPWWRAAPRPSEPARRWSAPSRCLPPAQCLQWNIGHIPARSQDLNKVRRNRGFDFFSKIITRKHSFASQMLRVNRKIRGDVIFLSKKKKLKYLGIVMLQAQQQQPQFPSQWCHCCGFADRDWPSLSPLPHKPQQGCTKMPEQQIPIPWAGTTQLSHCKIIQIKAAPPPPFQTPEFPWAGTPEAAEAWRWRGGGRTALAAWHYSQQHQIPVRNPQAGTALGSRSTSKPQMQFQHTQRIIPHFFTSTPSSWGITTSR